MIRYVLQFCLCQPDEFSPEKTETWDNEWTAALKPLTIWTNGLGDYKFDLTPPCGEKLLELLKKAQKEGGRLNSVGLEEELIDDDQTPAEWFELDPNYNGSEYFGGMDWDLKESIHEGNE